MKFAICDDHYKEIEPIAHYLTSQGHDVDYYESSNALLDAYRSQGKRYDALFLDLEIGGDLQGFELADAVQTIDDTALVAFVTGHHQYVYDCFRCSPVGFLRKPVDQDELAATTSHIQHLRDKRKRTFTVTGRKGNLRLRCEDILYFEAIDHLVIIHTKDGGTQNIRANLKDIEKTLDGTFCRIQASYLINLQYLIGTTREAQKTREGKKSQGREVVILEHCTEKLPIGRAFKDNVNAAFLKFKEDQYQL